MLQQKWGWICTAMALNIDDVEAAGGLDAAMMVEFADLSMQILVVIGQGTQGARAVLFGRAVVGDQDGLFLSFKRSPRFFFGQTQLWSRPSIGFDPLPSSFPLWGQPR